MNVAFTNRYLNMIIAVDGVFSLPLEKYTSIRCRQTSPGNPKHILGPWAWPKVSVCILKSLRATGMNKIW